MELTKAELEKVKTDIKKELMGDFEKMVEREVMKQLKGHAGEKRVKEITSAVLVKLFRVLWNRSSMWDKSIVQ